MHTTPRSLFIVVEGPDYSGKTTLIKKLKKLIQNNPKVQNSFKKILYTEEPRLSSPDFCKLTTQIVLENKEITDLTRALLFFANRSEHISKILEPELDKGGCLIICDRFYLSTLVYQGTGHDQWMDWIRDTQKLITSKTPDITYVLDIDQQTFTERYNITSSRNVMDDYAKDRFLFIRDRYIKFANNPDDENLGKIKIIRGNSSDEWAKLIESDIEKFIS